MQDFLHAPVAYFVLPLFALANTCILIDAGALHALASTVGLGIMAGLLLAFHHPWLVNISKLAVLSAPLLSGIAGFFWLKTSLSAGGSSSFAG